MARREETLIVKMAKHPLIWMGAGIWIRNYDYYNKSAEFWKTVGTVALLTGIAHSLDEHARGHRQGRTMAEIIQQILTPPDTIPLTTETAEIAESTT